MTVSQAPFRAALLDPDLPAPEGLEDGHGGAAGKRFDVYRNNVVVSLTEALATAFPLVRKLIGAQAFASVGSQFVRACPPSSPLMMHYGVDFPAFLEGVAPLKRYGYLPDCARLDLALRRSYHAADSLPVRPSVFCDAAAVAGLKLRPAPSTILLRSAWPLFDLWRFNQIPGSPAPRAAAQDVIVVRQDFDPAPHLLPPGAARWLGHLEEGLPFAEASERAVAAEADFDLAEALTLMLRLGALVQDR